MTLFLRYIFSVGLLFGFFQISAQLAGNYTIDPSAPASLTNYTNFNSAVSDLMSGTRTDAGSPNGPGVSASVVFSAAPNLYNERFTIGAITGTSAINSVLFQSQGDASTVTIDIQAMAAIDNYLVKFDGANNIEFRNITFRAPNTSGFGRHIEFTGNSNNIRIHNCIFDASPAKSTSNAEAIIFATTASAPFLSNLFIEDNLFKQGAIGIDLRSTGGSHSGITVLNNTFENQFYKGYQSFGVSNITIENNNWSTNSNGTLFTGINVDAPSGEVSIRGNYFNITNADGSVTGIRVNQHSSVSLLNHIANNMIGIAAMDKAVGVEFFSGCQNYLIAYNSIYLTGSNSTSAGVNEFGTSGLNNTLRNNIISNIGSGYCISITNIGTFSQLDNNDYYFKSNLGKWTTLIALNITSWQGFTSQEANSVSVDPNFVNPPSDLHLANLAPSSLQMGTAIPTITKDFDGGVRGVPAWIGGDEKGIGPIIVLPPASYPEEPGAGYAFDYDGIDDFAEVLDPDRDLQLQSELTVAFWVKPDVVDSYSSFVYYGGSMSSNLDQNIQYAVGLRGGVNAGKIYYMHEYNNAGVADSRSKTFDHLPLEVGKWTHIALTRDPLLTTEISLYINGILVDTYNYSDGLEPTNGSLATLSIGQNLSTTEAAKYYDGKMDELSIWDKALTETEIRNLVCKKITNTHSNYANLKAYYRYDDGVGMVLKDVTNNNNADIKNTLLGIEWPLSGASLGDESAYTYGGTSVTLNSEDQFTADNFQGGVDGLHVYFVNDTLLNAPPINDVLNYDETGYYGVFKVGEASATYDVTYDYTSNTFLNGHPNESNARLIKRSGNDDPGFTKVTGPAGTDTTANTIFLPNQTGTEYVIGFAAVAYPKEPGPGYALGFNGTSDLVTILDDNSLTPNSITIEAWVQFSGNGDGDIISKYNDNSGTQLDDSYQLIVRSGNLVFEVTDGISIGSSQISMANISASKWYHLAGVFNGAKVVLYVNGMAQSSGTLAGTLNNDAGRLLIGAGYDGGVIQSHFNGEIDEVRVWDTQINTSEIRGFMCAKNLTSHPNYANLVSYYRFDDGAGSTLRDVQNLNDGALNPGMKSWRLSGAAIGDTSIYNYGSPANLVMNQGAAGTFSVLNTSGVTDSLHVYFVIDTPNVVLPPTGIDSIDFPGYFGVFSAGWGTKNYDLEYDYSSNLKALSYAVEDSLKMVGRDKNSNTTWGLPNGGVVTTVNTASNKILVQPVSGRLEAILAFDSLGCDTSALAGTWVWTGAVNNDWFDCGNWDRGSVPGSLADVQIPGVTTVPAVNQPLISSDTAYCRTINLDLDDSSSLSIDVDSGGKLEVRRP